MSYTLMNDCTFTSRHLQRISSRILNSNVIYFYVLGFRQYLEFYLYSAIKMLPFACGFNAWFVVKFVLGKVRNFSS